VIVDGAHNDVSSKILNETIKRFTDKKVTLCFQCLVIKCICFLMNIKDVVSRIIITTVPNSYSRALSAYRIYDVAREIFGKDKIGIIENPRKAYFKSKKALSENEILLVTGSLYLVGFVRTLEDIFTFNAKLI